MTTARRLLRSAGFVLAILITTAGFGLFALGQWLGHIDRATHDTALATCIVGLLTILAGCISGLYLIDPPRLPHFNHTTAED